MKPQFRGTGIAIVTPFTLNGEIDFDALEKIIEFQISGGIDYLVSLGTTGEAITLSSEECLSVLKFTKNIVRERVPIIAGLFGRNDTRALVEKIKSFNFEGYAGILSSSPAYNKPSQEGLIAHFSALAESTEKPIILYSIPSRCGIEISTNTIAKLYQKYPNICANV